MPNSPPCYLNASITQIIKNVSSSNDSTGWIELADIENYDRYFIVDNTPYPFDGAYTGDFLLV